MICGTCDRPMRPQRAPIDAFPGTVKKGTGDECSTCTDRHRVLERPALKLCTRCGYPTRFYVLCADCRDTLTPAEQLEWVEPEQSKEDN